MKKALSILMLLFINAIFSYKYLSREFDYAWVVTIILIVIQLFGFLYVYKLNIPKKAFNSAALLASLGIVGMVILAYLKIPLESLNVDRWSVIDSFWSFYFDGKYPYLASSHMGNPPGSMPIYFIISLPFWWLGELSVFSSLGYLSILYLLVYRYDNLVERKAVLLYLVTSVFVVWELMVRSNIITNTILVMLALYWLQHTDIKNLKKSWPVAVILGLLLATRGNFAVVYILFFMYPLIKKEVTFIQLFKFTALSATVFASVFLIIIAIYGSVFFEANPFIFHSTLFVPTEYIIAFFVIAFILAFFSKSKNDLYFYSGLTLFSIILLYAINLVVIYGLSEAYTQHSWIDISYFLFSVPFLLFYLLRSQPLK
jgi:hypothetical protein